MSYVQSDADGNHINNAVLATAAKGDTVTIVISRWYGVSVDGDAALPAVVVGVGVGGVSASTNPVCRQIAVVNSASPTYSDVVVLSNVPAGDVVVSTSGDVGVVNVGLLVNTCVSAYISKPYVAPDSGVPVFVCK